MVAIAGLMEASNPGGMDETSPEAMIVGLCLFAGVGLALMGGTLGLIALVQPNRKKVFGILGLIFNAFVVLGVVGLIVIGLSMDA